MTALDPDNRLSDSHVQEEVRTGGGVRAGLTNFAYLAVPLLVLMAVWELAARLSGMPAALLPPVSSIFAAMFRLAADGLLLTDVAASLSRLFKSVFIGIVVGTTFGILMGYFRIWERLLAAPLNFLLAIPGTAMFPLSMIWFGLTEMAIIVILIYEVALTVTFNTWTGVKSVDGSLIRAGRALVPRACRCSGAS